MLSITVGAGGTIMLNGRFDASQVETARLTFDKIDGPRTIDCTNLEYISSAGLGVLLTTQKRLSSQGASLRITNLNPHIREVFRYAGFDQIFQIG